MAYNANKLALLSQNTNGTFRVWAYSSTDAFATVKASGYITDAYSKGMRAGDAIWVIDTDTGPTVTLAAIATCALPSTCTMAQTGVVPST